MGEDGVDRVKWDRGVRGLVEVGHTLISRLSHGDQVEIVWVVWASKLEVRPVRPDGGGGGHVAPLLNLRPDEAKS